MTDRREFLQSLATTPLLIQTQAKQAGPDERPYWLDVLQRIARPVLTNLAGQKLKTNMPVESHPRSSDRRKFTYLEALGRLLAGLSPWLELSTLSGTEENLRREFARLARQAVDAATNPTSPDLLNFSEGQQPLVDSAFLAHAILRAPTELWKKLDAKTQKNLVAALKSSRHIRPGFNNWLLFAAMVEAALCAMGEDWDAMRVDYAIRQHEQWYKGDGLYGDGPDFHWDYYNSFVIQPMLLDVIRVARNQQYNWDSFQEKVLKRAQRYAAIQERLISPEGTFPAIGRSLAYRFGAFHLLGQIVLQKRLPKEILPAQVRSALTAVIRRMIEAPGTFDQNGWLTIGFCGHQPAMGETYISTGSLYLCAVGLLPLGLPPEDEFWSAPAADWTARKVWAGQNLEADHAS
ncbi:MAG: DUF2264 domain-containing protein [Acidobacteria bacterium]|nr:DUF2264 domain-containing protein [Acidobacteriota bacterium]